MVKSLCKYRRAEIADQFATITKIVSQPKFICTSCTRVASDKNYLCNPSSLTNTEALKVAPMPTPVMTLAVATASAVDATNIHQLPIPTAVGQRRIEMVTLVEQAEVQPDKLVEQTEKLKKLAKKKNKLLKKAAKAVKKFDKQLRKTKKTLGLIS